MFFISVLFLIIYRSDPVLPPAAAGWCKDLLANGGASVTFHSHPGGHDVGHTTIPALLEFLTQI